MTISWSHAYKYTLPVNISLLIGITFLCAIENSYAKTFTREYTYDASEADSKITARDNALTQAKKLLLEEVGTYIQSEFSNSIREQKGSVTELTHSESMSLSSGITKTNILKEKWDGSTYYMMVEITIDEKDIKAELTHRSSLKKPPPPNSPPKVTSKTNVITITDGINIELVYYPDLKLRLSKYEITNEQYKLFTEDQSYKGKKHADGNYLKHYKKVHWLIALLKKREREPTVRPNQPVVYISWNNASDFCQWLSQKTGRKCRLPYKDELTKALQASRNGTRNENVLESLSVKDDFWCYCMDSADEHDEYKVLLHSVIDNRNTESSGSPESTNYRRFRTYDNIGFRIVCQ